MSPDPQPPLLVVAPPPCEPPDVYPFWGYLDLLGYVLIALLGSVVESLAMAALLSARHMKQIYVLMPAQVILYAFLMGSLALIFKRYYGRPFWQSVRWTRPSVNMPFVAACGVTAAMVVVITSVLIGTPDNDSPMKALLSEPSSALMIAVIGVTLAPVCEEIVFRGFLQPLLVRSLGAAPGILLAAAAFGFLHFQEYGNSWKHAMLIMLAGASFGWMRQRSGSTKAAALMHAAYNGVFFFLLAVQQVASHGHWAGR